MVLRSSGPVLCELLTGRLEAVGNQCLIARHALDWSSILTYPPRT
jgi:hypothetical protein